MLCSVRLLCSVQCRSVRAPARVQVVYCAAWRAALTVTAAAVSWLALFVLEINRNNKMKNGEIRKTEHIKVNIKVFRKDKKRKVIGP